jgi:hypothetical protein
MSPRTAFKTGCACIALLVLASGTVQAEDGKVYGEPLTGTETIEISELLGNPDPYLGKVVRVEGLVTDVCKKRGCWMSLAGDEEFQEIRIKVDDGVIVFPMEAKGKRAVAEGVFTKIEMTLEQTIAYREHHAEEHGEEFDPSTVTEPLVYYQIRGTGAVVR